MSDPNPQRPAQPASTPRKSRPVRPNSGADPLPTPQPIPAVPAWDDDLVIVPAPSPEDLVRKHTRPPRPKPTYDSVGFRRTLVPLLLTHGLLLPILGALWFLTDDDSPFRRLGRAAPLFLFAAGAILLAIGVLNVMYLKNLRSKGR